MSCSWDFCFEEPEPELCFFDERDPDWDFRFEEPEPECFEEPDPELCFFDEWDPEWDLRFEELRDPEPDNDLFRL